MLIWLGVVVTVLCIVGMAILWQLCVANSILNDGLVSVSQSAEAISKSCHEHLTAVESASRMFGKALHDENDRAAAEMGKVFQAGMLSFSTRTDLAIADWKTTFTAFGKAQQELADNLGLLLREIKVSKQLAAGSIALVEQNVVAIDKMLRLIEALRAGPRVPTRIAPTDEDAAAHERGEDDQQQAAIDAMLAGAKARAEAQDDFM